MKVLLGIINKLGEYDLTKASQEKLLNLTDFWIYNATQNCNLDLTIEYFNTEQDCIEYATSGTFKFVIGSAAGHLLRPGNANKLNVLEETVKLCQQSDGLVGHIMANPNRVPYFYDEYWCIDLNKFKQYSNPKWEMLDSTTFPGFISSEENFHSDYTPYYLNPLNQENNVLSVVNKCGTGVIESWLKYNKRIVNFPQYIRGLKHHLYPEHSIYLDKYLNGDITVDGLQQELQLQYFKQVDYEHAKECIFLFNTDSLQFNVPDEPIDTLVSVCAAFRPYLILNRSGFNESTSVKFIDYSDISLQFKKWLLENWDGKDIFKTIKLFEKHTNKSINWNKPFHLSYEESYFEVIKEFGGQDNWLQFWERYRQLDHEYHLIDLVDNTEKIEDLLGNKQNYLYISNSFNTEAGLIKHGRTKLLSKFKEITEIAFKHNSVFDGSDLDHHYPNPDYIKNVVKFYNFL